MIKLKSLAPLFALSIALVAAIPAAAQFAAPTISNVAIGGTDGRDLIDLNTVPPASAGTGLSGSATADAPADAGAAVDGIVPPHRGIERHARVTASREMRGDPR